jgi:hypothetical protein
MRSNVIRNIVVRTNSTDDMSVLTVQARNNSVTFNRPFNSRLKITNRSFHLTAPAL